MPRPRLATLVAVLVLAACSAPSGSTKGSLDTRLIAAAWANDVAAAQRLIADGADVTAKDSFNGTGLIRAAERGHAVVVGRLLRAGIAVDHVNRLGWTALHEAIVLGKGTADYEDTVRALVAGRADLRLPPKGDGIAPVDHAQRRGFTTIATTLRRGLDTPAPTDPDAALLAAATAGDADGAAVAPRAGAALEARDDRRRTPLLETVILGDGSARYQEIVRILLAAGADRSVADRDGVTALQHAQRRGQVEVSRLLSA